MQGDYFGERALLYDEQRSATVTAASKVKLMRLDKHSFVTLLGELHAELLERAPKDEHKMKNNASPASKRNPPLGGTQQTPSTEAASIATAATSTSAVGETQAYKRPQRSVPKATSLLLVKQLGSGGYGRVSLVRDTKTRRVFALKRVCKAHLLGHNGVMRCEWLLREKQVLEQLEHPFIVSLYATFADHANLYLLLGVALGGDLYRLIEKLGQVTVDHTFTVNQQ